LPELVHSTFNFPIFNFLDQEIELEIEEVELDVSDKRNKLNGSLYHKFRNKKSVDRRCIHVDR
jgi:hypothetical protein